MIESEMSLDQMRGYKGINPRPLNFDDFWNDCLQELNQIDPDISIEETDFTVPFAKCYHLYFTSTKGARIYAKLIRPIDLQIKGPGLLIFHGYSGNSGGWSEKPTKLCYAAMGFTVAAMECRGQGGKSIDSGYSKGWSLRGHIVRGIIDNPNNLMYRDIFLDTVQLAKVVMNLDGVDPNRIGVTGESQGGALSIACAALVPQIKKIAPIFPFLCDYKRAWQLNTEDSAYMEINEYIRRFDPRHEKLDEIFNTLGYIDIQHLSGRIKGETLMAIALSDTRCPPSTQFAMYNKIRAEKSIRIYPDYGHERLPDHSDEIFQFLKML
ncbi:MAG TPA: acetylxylan esterase [Bacteroidia bacterium]|nr:acetylxylan esterase [Bacteroidia bacterium]